MFCYRCHSDAGKAKICPACSTDLTYFQKARKISLAYYNRGLEQASVRNLSGAVESLQKSLKFYKLNTDARNLLGLVYFEMGETVDAITEWVISKNFQPDENRADFYLSEIQQNRARLDTVNQTIKKYNQALLYCKQDSRDLAIIQLKKVLSLNPRLVKGHQLLALLYLQEGKLDLAKKTLRNAGKIDSDNTTTLRYLKEVNRQIKEQESGHKKKPAEEELISYQSGNETIIMPKRFHETSFGATLIAVVAGILVGAAAVGFLVIPNVKKNAGNDTKQALLAANETISSDQQKMDDLNSQIEELQDEVDAATSTSEQMTELTTAYDNLTNAYAAFASADYVSAGNYLGLVDQNALSDTGKTCYQTLSTQITDQYIAQMWTDGYAAYVQGDLATAITDLQTVVDHDEAYSDGQAVYYLAQSMRKNGDEEGAKPYYQYVIDNYPDTERAATAQRYVD